MSCIRLLFYFIAISIVTTLSSATAAGQGQVSPVPQNKKVRARTSRPNPKIEVVTPADDSLTDSYTPTIRIEYWQPELPGWDAELLPGTLRIEIDGQDCTSFFTIHPDHAVWQVPPEMAFPPGTITIHGKIPAMHP